MRMGALEVGKKTSLWPSIWLLILRAYIYINTHTSPLNTSGSFWVRIALAVVRSSAVLSVWLLGAVDAVCVCSVYRRHFKVVSD